MEELKEFFKDIKRIENALEKIVADNNDANVFINNTLKEVKSKVTNAVDENATSAQNQVVQPAVQASIPTAIPVTNTVQTYSQDQLSVAMARALDMGMMTEIQNILNGLGVDSLMALNPDRYNDLALRLREIGVEV